MIEQDSTDPTGIKAPARTNRDPNHATRPRQRKANAALELALEGRRWDEIALALGYPTARTARVAVETALEKQLNTIEDRTKMRQLAGARLDRLLRGVWTKANNPDHPEHLIATTKARELIGDHRKLYGLDAPTEIVVHRPDQAEIEAFVARLTHPAPVVEYDIIEGQIVEESTTPAFEAGGT